MLSYAIKRIGLAVLIIFVVMLAMYAMVFLVPGDPASLALGPRATPELKRALGYCEEALKTAQKGQLVGPFATEGGWAILRVEDKRMKNRAAITKTPGP